MPTLEDIRQNVESCFGFFPPFFEPAANQPLVLEGLWKHFQGSYLENPLPAIFKERLGALLARNSACPYFCQSPSSSVTPVGRTLDRVTAELDLAPLSPDELSNQESILQEQALPQWPATNTPAERGILYCCLSIFLRQQTDRCQKLLRALLPQREYNCLQLLLAYLQSCLQWAEAHPDLHPSPDSLACRYLEKFLALNSDQGPIFDSLREQLSWHTSSQTRLFAERHRLLAECVEALQDGFLIIGPDLVLRWSNQSAIQLLGLPVQTRIGTHLDSLAPLGHGEPGTAVLSPEWARFLSLISNSLSLGRPHHGQLLLSGRNIQLHAHPNRDGSLALFLSDVTSEREVEINISPREQELAQALDISRVGYFEILLTQRRVILSHQMRRDWKLPLEKEFFTVKEAFSFIHPEDQENVSQIFEHCYATLSPFSGECRIVTPEGHICWIEAHGRVDSDESGRAQRLIGTCQDISARKQIDANLRQSEELFRTFVEWAPYLTFIADGEGQVLYNNRRWVEYVGTETPKRCLGNDFIHSEDAASSPQFWKDHFLSGQPFESEFRLRSADGHYRWHKSRCLPVRNEEGQIIKWFGIHVDIHDQMTLTQEQQLAREAADAANRAKTGFLTNISHELRTPLTAILGFCELEEADQHSSLPIIRRNANQLLRVVDTLLDLSKIEAGTLHLDSRIFSAHEVFQQVTDTFAPLAREKSLEFVFEVASGFPEQLEGDPVRLRQILSHLVDNAAKFTVSGKIHGRMLHQDGELIIRVEDTGPGMPSQLLQHLFEEREKNGADSEPAEAPSNAGLTLGQGLGLAFTRKLCQQLNGSLSVERSQPGPGSLFIVRLPCAEAKLEKCPVQQVRHQQILAGYDILLVEDSPDVGALHAAMLEVGGAAVARAENGQDCLDIVDSKNFAAVLMDIQMPVMDGFTATKHLRQRGHQVPIIALTAHSMQDEREHCLREGFDDYLTKPVSLSHLLECLARHCQQGRTLKV